MASKGDIHNPHKQLFAFVEGLRDVLRPKMDLDTQKRVVFS